MCWPKQAHREAKASGVEEQFSQEEQHVLGHGLASAGYCGKQS